MKKLIQSEKSKAFITVIATISCLALSPIARAVVPPPDGGYANFTTAEGQNALFSLTSGAANTAVGWFSLKSVTTGNFNTGVGAGTLVLNTGDANTATGTAALLLNTTGQRNTANGTAALVNNSTGEDNTAVGAFALNSNTATGNTAIGSQALFNNTEGVNNTATGVNALLNNNTGSNNTAIGADALFTNVAGNFNTAVGGGALASNAAGANTATGALALHDNVAGDSNTADGALTLQHNNGSGNTATGFAALSNNTTGINNTATGDGALQSNTSGFSNTAVGHNALLSNGILNNIVGQQNTAVGAGALSSNINGSDNTSVGFAALSNSTGDGNIAIGHIAGNQVTTASSVICIGALGANVNFSCYIGHIWNQPGGSQAVFVNSDGKLGAQVSSRRFKEEIKPMEHASEAIFSLNPVSFRYKKEIDPAGASQFGLVAEDVEKVNPNLVIRDKDGKPYTVRYDQVNAMLLNEFLKEHCKVEELTSRMAKQETTIAQQQNDFRAIAAEHEREIRALTVTVKEQAIQIQKVSARLEVSEPRSQTVLNHP